MEQSELFLTKLQFTLMETEKVLFTTLPLASNVLCFELRMKINNNVLMSYYTNRQLIISRFRMRPFNKIKFANNRSKFNSKEIAFINGNDVADQENTFYSKYTLRRNEWIPSSFFLFKVHVLFTYKSALGEKEQRGKSQKRWRYIGEAIAAPASNSWWLKL